MQIFNIQYDGSEVTLLVAFLAGIITFFASCLLPLVPTYIAYLSGVHTLSDKSKSSVLQAAYFFVIGFVSVFMLLGVLARVFSTIIGQYRIIATQLSGVFFILIGLFMLNVFKHFGQTEYKLHIEKHFQKNTVLHGLLTGVGFGLGWSPCIGPVLAIILYWSAIQETMLRGLGLLFTYGLGLGLPFLITAYGYSHVLKAIGRHPKIHSAINSIAALVLIATGIAMLTNTIQTLSFWLLSLTNIEKFAQ